MYLIIFFNLKFQIISTFFISYITSLEPRRKQGHDVLPPFKSYSNWQRHPNSLPQGSNPGSTQHQIVHRASQNSSPLSPATIDSMGMQSNQQFRFTPDENSVANGQLPIFTSSANAENMTNQFVQTVCLILELFYPDGNGTNSEHGGHEANNRSNRRRGNGHRKNQLGPSDPFHYAH